MSRALNSLQVAALLVSCSYGIGFLFGSGEMALQHGMAGSIYGLATGIGMLLLAGFAARLWRGGAAIWDLLGRAYGPSVKHAVAALSIVWMAGVLAAQIHGGVAIMQLLGLKGWPAFGAILACMFGASRLHLGLASKIFTVLLLSSGFVLLCVLFSGSGAQFYARSPALFLRDLATFDGASLVSITVAITALVCTGADYHQFLLAARRPLDATVGCLLAAAALIALSFVPASVVLGLQHEGGLGSLADTRQVIPFALTQAAEGLGIASLGAMFLAGLLGAALGCGAAIVRAMASALEAATQGRIDDARAWPSALVLCLGAALAVRGQGIVATMVSVNVIYIASIAVTFVCMVAGRPLPLRAAKGAMCFGFAASTAVYVAHRARPAEGNADLMSLVAGLVASVLVCAVDSLRNAKVARRA